MSTPHLAVSHIAKAFGGVEAVRDVSLTLARGEILALIGPNGAGKSTCFNMLNGQIVPDRGCITVGGRDLTGAPPEAFWRAGIGRTFQVTATFASMSVSENVQLALISAAGEASRLLGFAGARHLAEAEALLALVGMEQATGRACGELAYGDLKRLELAIALASKPSLLFMDEPTAGMGAAEREALMRLVAGLARSHDIGVLFTEHDMGVVFAHADRILVLDRGRLIASGTPDEIREDRQVRSVYLGESLASGGSGRA